MAAKARARKHRSHAGTRDLSRDRAPVGAAATRTRGCRSPAHGGWPERPRDCRRGCRSTAAPRPRNSAAPAARCSNNWRELAIPGIAPPEMRNAFVHSLQLGEGDGRLQVSVFKIEAQHRMQIVATRATEAPALVLQFLQPVLRF